MTLTTEENARQAALKILKILDEHHLTKRQVRIVFDIIMEDFHYTSRGWVTL